MAVFIGPAIVNKIYLGVNRLNKIMLGANELFPRFTDTPPVGFNPASLFASGEQGAWYDFSDLSTLFQDSAGTTPVTTDGQPVGKVLDKSGNGNHLIQATAAARPAYRIAGGLHSAEFDGADDLLVSATSGGFVEQTLLSGFYFPSGQTLSKDLLNDYSGGGGFRVWLRNTPTATAYIYTAGGNAGPTFPVPGTVVGTFGYDGTAVKGQINNNAFYSRNEVLAGDTTAGFTISDVSNRMIGNIHQVIYINRYLTTQELVDAKKYIAEKSGVTLT